VFDDITDIDALTATYNTQFSHFQVACSVVVIGRRAGPGHLARRGAWQAESGGAAEAGETDIAAAILDNAVNLGDVNDCPRTKRRIWFSFFRSVGHVSGSNIPQ
jgi:hypothetical protein